MKFSVYRQTDSRRTSPLFPRKARSHLHHLGPAESHIVLGCHQIGGGGTYASIGARMWLPPNELGMIVDRGIDFPPDVQTTLDAYGSEMWLFRDKETRTTRARNTYENGLQSFEYLTPRTRISPRDLKDTGLDQCSILHFVCSPQRAAIICEEIRQVEGWKPITIYEPIPDRCIPSELPALMNVLQFISILSPNAEEALSLLGLPLPPTKIAIESAALSLLRLSSEGPDCVIIRSGHLGAYIFSRKDDHGQWVDAYWGPQDAARIVDVTGAGNAFLGGLAAGLALCEGNVHQAALYGTISASFTIEQLGLPVLSHRDGDWERERWNNDLPEGRLRELRERVQLRTA